MYLPSINNVKRTQLSSSKKMVTCCFAYYRTLKTTTQAIFSTSKYISQALENIREPESQGVINQRDTLTEFDNLPQSHLCRAAGAEEVINLRAQKKGGGGERKKYYSSRRH